MYFPGFYNVAVRPTLHTLQKREKTNSKQTLNWLLQGAQGFSQMEIANHEILQCEFHYSLKIVYEQERPHHQRFSSLIWFSLSGLF